MFSGIVETIGSVVRVDEHVQGVAIDVRSELFGELERSNLGDSIAVNGVCLTVAQISEKNRRFDLASETRRRTTLGMLRVGSTVNLERALLFGGSVNGHLVQGHVDDAVEILSRTSEGNTERVEIFLPEVLRRYVVPKGSVTLDGVSLTVGEVGDRSFSVYLIPHTLSQTILSEWRASAKVNLEIDLMARYVEGLTRSYFA